MPRLVACLIFVGLLTFQPPHELRTSDTQAILQASYRSRCEM